MKFHAKCLTHYQERCVTDQEKNSQQTVYNDSIVIRPLKESEIPSSTQLNSFAE